MNILKVAISQRHAQSLIVSGGIITPSLKKEIDMQEVKVKDIKVKSGITESGARAGQKWEMIIIIGEDGSEFTTFDTKAKEVGIGGVIELEPTLKAGKVNFSKFTIKSKGQEVSPGVHNGDDSPEKRKSIENQTRAYIISDLYKAEKLLYSDSLVTKLLAWLDELGQPLPQKAKTSEKKATIPAGDWPQLENLGQLYTRAQTFGLSPRDVHVSVGIGKGENIVDFDEAWKATAERFANSIKAAQETSKIE